MALGALIIKEKLGISDRETVEQIKENPYLQYFIGMSNYSNDSPFEASMMVYFRERIKMDFIKKINQKMVKDFQEETPREEKKEEQELAEVKNQGKLILDATVAPADITHPNDLGILNQTRKQSEKILDSLYQNCQNKLERQPRSYRNKARKDYLKVAKKRRVSRRERTDAIAKQLKYIKRNLSHIDNLINSGAELSSLSPRKYKMLLVITEVDRQQLWMHENEANRIDDRIVSISLPHIRPIVRGKAGKPVEFERGGRCFASSLSNHAVGAKLESLLLGKLCIFRPFKERIILMSLETYKNKLKNIKTTLDLTHHQFM